MLTRMIQYNNLLVTYHFNNLFDVINANDVNVIHTL